MIIGSKDYERMKRRCIMQFFMMLFYLENNEISTENALQLSEGMCLGRGRFLLKLFVY